jgi:hypothetical protein
VTSDPEEPKHGIISAVAHVGSQVVSSLQPQFLALILVNVMFMAAFVWFVDGRARHTVEIIQALLESCLKNKP